MRPVLCSVVLCHMQSLASRSVCAGQISFLQGNLTLLIIEEDSAGNSPLVPAITPPASPCLYLKVQQDVLMQTSSLFNCKNDE